MAYAIIKTGGKQYKVSEGDRIDVEKLDFAVGDTATLSEVLMVSGDGGLKLGDPVVDGATVTAEVVEQYRAKKTLSFKFKRRKGFHKTRGHRRHLTTLAIKAING